MWLALFSSGAARAQTASPTPAETKTLAFAVVSVKQFAGTNYPYLGILDSPDGLHAIISLKGLTASAYGFRDEFVTCKIAWCDSTIFDIQAKLEEIGQMTSQSSHVRRTGFYSSRCSTNASV